MNLKDRLYAATFSENFKECIQTFGAGMEINHTCISQSLDDEPGCRSAVISAISDDITESGAKKLLLHGPFTEIYPSAIDPRARELASLRLNQAYTIAEHFGVKKMVVHNGWLPFIYFKSWHTEKGAAFWQSFLEDKPDNFILCVENVLEDEPFMLRDMILQAGDPRVRLCLDTGHANAMTQPDICVEKWIEVLGPYISHFHLHNNDGSKDSHSPFHMGSLNMERILRTAEKFCPEDVTFTVEARDCLSCFIWLKERGFV